MSGSTEEKEQLNEILERSEYQAYEQGGTAREHLMDVITAWVKELLSAWFPDFQVSDSAINGWIYFFGLIGMGVLILLVVKLAGRISGEKTLPEQRTFRMDTDFGWSSEKHLKEAALQAGDEQYSEAARHTFLGMLLNFDAREMVDVQSWKTNSDYEKELQSFEKGMLDDFAYLADTFDQITYGHRSLRKEEYNDYRSRAFRWMDGERRREA